MKRMCTMILLLLCANTLKSMNKQKSTDNPPRIKSGNQNTFIENDKTINTKKNENQGCFFCCSETDCLKKFNMTKQ